VQRRHCRDEGTEVNRECKRASTELGDMVLVVFEHAIRHRQAGVAEHLLCALEELARTRMECRATLDRAYLLIGRSGLSR
jgi:hypothetical protein